VAGTELLPIGTTVMPSGIAVFAASGGGEEGLALGTSPGGADGDGTGPGTVSEVGTDSVDEDAAPCGCGV
jgi:hypothetical protein